MTIQEILQEIKKIADNNSFVNFSYIGDVEELEEFVNFINDENVKNKKFEVVEI